MADVPIADPFASTVAARLQAIERVTAALRCGLPAQLTDDLAGPALMVLAAETATGDGLAWLASGAASAPILLLAAARVSAQGAEGEVAAFALPLGIDPRLLLTLADPARRQDLSTLEPAALPPGAEAAIALAKLAHLLPAVLVAPALDHALNDDASASAADVLGHASLSAATLTRVSEAVVPLAGIADCRIVAFRAPGAGQDHLAILLGRPEAALEPLVRVHSECFTGDLLGSLRCDCGAQLHGAIARIAAEGAGAVLYLAQEGRGIGLANKLRAYALQDAGLDTLDANRALGFAADERDFQVAAAMLRELRLTRVRLLTNNPAKLASLGQHGIEVTARVGLRFASNGVNDGYLATKVERFGHMEGPFSDA